MTLLSDVRAHGGRGLVGLGLILLVVVTIGSAIFAPPVNQTTGPDTADRGKTIVGVQGTPDGRLVMLNSTGAVVWTHNDAHGYHDVTPLPGGDILTAAITGDHKNCGPYSSPCFRTGYHVVSVTSTGETKTVESWTFPVRTGLNSEVHDVEPLPNGGVVVADMDHERIMTVSENGEITWQWNASSYYEAPADPTKTDWLHINDVDRIKNGTYMVSVRNKNQILFITPGNGVTDVINKNGNSSVMYRQHNPQYLGPGAVLVADSENNRIVELHRQNGSWTPVWSVSSAGGIKFNWPRDADRLPNGHTLITDSRNNRVVEIDENETVVWSKSVPGLPYEADRVQHQEPAGNLPTMTEIHNGTVQPGGDSASASDTRSLPVVGQVYAGLDHTVGLPYWIGEWHLIAWFVGLVSLGAGLRSWRPSLTTFRQQARPVRTTDVEPAVGTFTGYVAAVSAADTVEPEELVVVRGEDFTDPVIGTVTAVRRASDHAEFDVEAIVSDQSYTVVVSADGATITTDTDGADTDTNNADGATTEVTDLSRYRPV